MTEPLTPELVDYLEKVEWGFESGVRYKILDRSPMLKRILSYGSFHLLRKDQKLIGTILSVRKSISLTNGSSVDASYVSILSVLPSETGKGHAKELVQATRLEEDGRHIEYAYVEKKNIPSSAVFKSQGYHCIGQFYATTFNRLRTKQSTRISRLPAGFTEMLRNQLSDLYHDHSFLDLDISLHPDQYWVITESGQIIAGAQVEEELWSITSMPGPEGWFAVKILPHLPLLRRLLNPERIPVLRIGNLYVEEGREKAFLELIEHLTCTFRKKLALAYLDKRSPLYQRLKKHLWFGIFNSLFETPVNIWARFCGFQDAEIEALKKQPFLISPLDIS